MDAESGLLATEYVANGEGNIGTSKEEEPKVGMLFVDLDAMFEFWKSYAKRMGFPAKKRSTAKGPDGDVKYATLACSREGTHVSKSMYSKTGTTCKMGCKAKVQGIFQFGQWKIQKVCLEHNHGLSPAKSRFFRCNRVVSANVRRELILSDKAGIRVNKVYNKQVEQAGGHDKMTSNQRDFRNVVEHERRLRLGEGDAAAILKYFADMQALNNNFFFSIFLDDEGRLKNVFWADGRSREAYKEFGDVITFDSTYLTNKYNMPFAPFVGVNHHGQSILLGCALISYEDTDTYEWVFRTWLQCMHSRHPDAIITDQASSICTAIENVFPHTKHRLCLWHILKKLPEKFGGYPEYEKIVSYFQRIVYDSQTPAKFEESWKKMVSKYKLQESTWVATRFSDRHRWAPCYVKTSFWAGMASSGRSESMNAFFDGYVNHKTSLKQFVEQYDRAVRAKIAKEEEADCRCLSQVVGLETKYEIEKQAREVYTLDAFKWFQKELRGKLYCQLTPIGEDATIVKYEIREDVHLEEGTVKKNYIVQFTKDSKDVQCSCLKFEYKGILCRHAIDVMIRNEVKSIPEKYFLRRWRKDVRRAHTRIMIKQVGWCETKEQSQYDELCNLFTKVADIAAQDDEIYKQMKEWIEIKVTELMKKKSSARSNQSPTSKAPPTLPTPSTPHSVVDSTDNVINNVLDPVQIKRKGRPRSTVIKSAIPKKPRKKRAKKGEASDPPPKDPPPVEVPSQVFGFAQSNLHVPPHPYHGMSNTALLHNVNAFHSRPPPHLPYFMYNFGLPGEYAHGGGSNFGDVNRG